MAQRLVCESSPIDIGEKNAIKDKNGNFYAVIRVYALGFDINTLEIKKDGLIDDIIKRNTYYEVYIVCIGYKTKIEMSTRTNGYLSVPIITQGDYSDSNDEEYEYLNDHFAESAGLLAMTPDGGYSLTFGSDTYMKDYIFYRNETLN
jgi:hypothetical protein